MCAWVLLLLLNYSLLLQVLFRGIHYSCSRFNADKQVTVNAEEYFFFFFFFFFFLTALLAFYSDTIVVNEKLHVHKCEGEK